MPEKTVYSKKDWLSAALVSLFVLLVAICYVTKGVSDWGDDFAAYISEGIAIADGSFEEQIRINYQYHPSELPNEANNGTLVYVWGYPLIIAIIYKIVGFDFNSIIWYKIPLLLSLSLTGGALFLFFRRRFSLLVAVFLTLMFCMSGNLVEDVNRLLSDLPFLFLTVLTLLLMECYAQSGTLWQGVLFGAVMWLTYETRLSGFTVCGVALIGHMIRKKKQIISQLVPYLILVVLVFISEHLWLAPATPNLSDLKETSIGFPEYAEMIYRYLEGLTKLHLNWPGFLFAAVCVLGIVVKGFGENTHLTVLLAGTLIVDSALPYKQGLRYLYPILPIILMYIMYGFEFLGALLRKRIDQKHYKWIETGAGVLATIMLYLSCGSYVYTAVGKLQHWGDILDTDVYSEEAISTYRFIQHKVSTDKTIAFFKPRALYLNTERMSFRPGYNGHELKNADYYLRYKIRADESEKNSTADINMEAVMDNSAFTLFEIKK